MKGREGIKREPFIPTDKFDHVLEIASGFLTTTAMPMPLGTSALPAKLGWLRQGESTPGRQNLLQADPLGTVRNGPAPREGILRSSAVLNGHDVPRRKTPEEVRPSRRLLPSPVSACPRTLPLAAAPHRNSATHSGQPGMQSPSVALVVPPPTQIRAKLRSSWGG